MYLSIYHLIFLKITFLKKNYILFLPCVCDAFNLYRFDHKKISVVKQRIGKLVD